MDYLFEKDEYTDYIINYLLIHLQVRNQDLDFDIIKRKKDANDKNKNYMWLQQNKLTYIRNVYKTANIVKPDGSTTGYGQKVNFITNPKMVLAVKRVHGCQKSDLDCGTFIPNKSSIAYHLQKATYKELGESKYFKIIVNHFRKDLDKLKVQPKLQGNYPELSKEQLDKLKVKPKLEGSYPALSEEELDKLKQYSKGGGS